MSDRQPILCGFLSRPECPTRVAKLGAVGNMAVHVIAVAAWVVALVFNPARRAIADEPPAAPVATRSAAELSARFQNQIWPLLQTKCLGCHGEGKELDGELDLRNRSVLLKGGASGPAIKAGDAASSLLIKAVRSKGDLKMPPQERNRLTEAQVKLLEDWIDAGAPWPARRPPPLKTQDDDTAAEVLVKSTAGLSPDWTDRRYPREDVWAYRPLNVAPVPTGFAHPIDGFVQQGLDSAGLEAADRADSATLIRRAAVDLWGLLPTPGEVARIESLTRDRDLESWSAAIDLMLADPRYGEQQARHWLDVTRYADSSGFSNDYERPHAWRWRDYVIRSFNADKSFDRFVLEQIAGDELAPDDPEMRVAAGFLRMGPWEHTGMSVAAVTRQQFLDDVTHSVGVVFFGQALRCAACHDHKFDPIPTRDYYRIQAVFAPTQFAELPTEFLPAESFRAKPGDVARLKKLLTDAQSRRSAIEAKNRQAVSQLLSARGVTKVSELPAADQTNARFYGLTEQEKSEDKILQKAIDYFQRSLLRYEPLAMSVYNGPANDYTSTKVRNELPSTAARPSDQRTPDKQQGTDPSGNNPPNDVSAVRVLLGGSLEAPGDVVTPGVLSAVWGSDESIQPGDWAFVPDETHGRRAALARWIASPRNTLTARVIVNRVWQQHFGQGIVSTSNNFGVMGGKPTHPELLDWLAQWLIDHDWSLKQLHRLIVTSETYCRRSSDGQGEALAQRDPKNQWLAVFPARRMAAEELRDSLLSVSGELNRAMGGPPAEPEIHWEVALQPRHIMGSVAPAYQPAPRPADRHRRTVYALRVRTLPDPLLEVFNRPGPDISCDRRDSTTVTPQVFALWNGQFAHDRALALADRIVREQSPFQERLDAVFQIVLGRVPSDAERSLCQQHVTRLTAFHEAHPPAPSALPTTVVREMIEELTGETVRWEEQLDRMRDFQPDLKPWQVGPDTRAWADLCLVLLNTNEFAYVR